MAHSPIEPGFTPKQGQYLAFIYAYTRVLGRPPAEADLQRYFGVIWGSQTRFHLAGSTPAG